LPTGIYAGCCYSATHVRGRSLPSPPLPSPPRPPPPPYPPHPSFPLCAAPRSSLEQSAEDVAVLLCRRSKLRQIFAPFRDEKIVDGRLQPDRTDRCRTEGGREGDSEEERQPTGAAQLQRHGSGASAIVSCTPVSLAHPCLPHTHVPGTPAALARLLRLPSKQGHTWGWRSLNTSTSSSSYTTSEGTSFCKTLSKTERARVSLPPAYSSLSHLPGRAGAEPTSGRGGQGEGGRTGRRGQVRETRALGACAPCGARP